MDAVTRPKGKVWRKMRTGDRVGQPLAEWAYVTPDTPSGVTPGKLSFEDRERQLFVMECWYRANYRAAEGVILGALNTVPLNTMPLNASMAVPPMAGELLMSEFSKIVPDDVIAELAERLSPQAPAHWVPTPPLLTADAYAERIMERLDGLEATLAKIGSASRGMGDNHPPEPMLSAPISAEDRDAAAEAIREVRRQLAARKPDLAAVERAASLFHGLRNKLLGLLAGVGAGVVGNMATPLAQRALHDLEALIPDLWHWIQASMF